MAPLSRIPNQQPLDFETRITDTVIPVETRAILGSLAMTPEEMAATPQSVIPIDAPATSARDRFLAERDSAFARRSKAQYTPSHGMSRSRQRQ